MDAKHFDVVTRVQVMEATSRLRLLQGVVGGTITAGLVSFGVQSVDAEAPCCATMRNDAAADFQRRVSSRGKGQCRIRTFRRDQDAARVRRGGYSECVSSSGECTGYA